MPQQTKVFRVFVSSTFSDMTEERRILQRSVFPRLEKFCEERGAKFQAVDLRWGVTEESQLNQKTLEICLNEISRCQKISPRPNFLVLLGNRYGWQPVPAKIPVDELGKILQVTDKKDLLNKWYRLDENSTPPEYILQPRSKELTENIWAEEANKIQAALRNAVNQLHFDVYQNIKYFTSATHQEIVSGALFPKGTEEKPEDHVFAMIRETEGMPPDDTAKNYIDLADGSPDPYSAQQLDDLKTQLQKKLGSHCVSYPATWDEGKTSIKDPVRFGKGIYDFLEGIISEQINHVISLDEIEHEKSLHKEFLIRLTESFYGRNEILETLGTYLKNQPDRKVLAMIGDSGSGKSSVMAKAALEAETGGANALIVYRFIGTSSRSSNIISLLQSICEQIAVAFGTNMTALAGEGQEKSLYDLNGLAGILKKCLALGTVQKPVIVFLDALDQLSDSDNARSLYWLPGELPEHARVIVSALPDLEAQLSNHNVIHLPLLPPGEAEEILGRWLKAVNRTLTHDQHAEVIEKFKHSGLPIYLKLAFEQARQWKSYTDNFTLKADVKGIINNYIDMLDAEHTQDLVQDVICLMLCGRYQGLAENEILEIFAFDEELWGNFLNKTHPSHRQELVEMKEELQSAMKIPIVVWSRLYLDLEPYLTERDADGVPIITFFHRQFNELLIERYKLNEEIIDFRQAIKSGEERLQSYNKKLGYYFNAKAFGHNNNWSGNYRRGFSELIFHFAQSEEWLKIETILTDFNFLMGKSKLVLTEGILNDYHLVFKTAPENVKIGLKIWRAFFRERIHILRRGSTEWPAYKILFQLAIEHAEDSPLTIASEKYLNEGKIDWIWLRRESKTRHLKMSQCLLTFEGHKESLSNAIVISNGNILSWSGDFRSKDHNIRIWNKDTGACHNILEGHIGTIHGVFELTNNRLLSWSDDTTLRLWDYINGECLKIFKGHTNSVYGVVKISNGHLLSWSGDTTLRLWDIEKGDCLRVFNGHTASLYGAMELSGNQILSWGQDKTLRSWNRDSAECLKVFIGHTEWVWNAAELSNGTILSSASGQYADDPIIRIWDREDAVCLFQIEGHGAIELSDGSILTWPTDGNLKIWSKENGNCLAISNKHFYKLVKGIELTNGNILVWTGHYNNPNFLYIWKREDKNSVIELTGHTDSIVGAFELSDGRILSWSNDTTLRIWDRDNGNCLSVLKGHYGWIKGAFELPHNQILSWSKDNFLRIWDATVTGDYGLTEGHDGYINGTVELANGKILTWSEDKTLRIWNHKNGKCDKILKGSKDAIGGAIELENKRLLSWPNWMSSPKEYNLLLWDGEAGSCVASLHGHTSVIANAIELSDGRILSWAKFIDTKLRIWNSKSGECLAVLEGHKNDINGALELYDGRILSWSINGPLRIWDKYSGQCVLILEGYDDYYGTLEKAIELSNGRILYWVSGSRDHDNLFRLGDNRNGKVLASFEWDQTTIEGAIELSDGIILSCSNSTTFRIWDTKNGECQEVFNKDELFRQHPEWYVRFYDLPDVFSKYFAHAKECTILLEPNLCHWEAESLSSATNLTPEGSLVITQKNGQVCFLKLYNGPLPISFEELYWRMP